MVLDFTVISVSVETTKVQLERRLPLSEADGVDGLQFLLCEVVFFFLSDRRVTGVGGGDGGDSTASFVVLDDLDLLSISHALVKHGLSGLHDLGSEVVTETGHEELVPKELLHVLDPFGLHGCEVGGHDGRHSRGHRCRDRPQGADVSGLGLAHFVEGLADPQVVVPDALPRALHQLMKVSAGRLGSVPRLVHCQEFILDVVPNSAVDSGIRQ